MFPVTVLSSHCLIFGFISMEPKEADDECACEACPETVWNFCFDDGVPLTLHNVCGGHHSVPGLRIWGVGKMTLRENVIELYSGTEWTPALLMTIRLTLTWRMGNFLWIHPVKGKDVTDWNSVLVSIMCHLYIASSHLGGETEAWSLCHITKMNNWVTYLLD